MYERFYGLRERPFSLSPDPEYLFLGRSRREALGYIRYGIEGQTGFIVLTGDIGCGKTTLLQTVMAGLDRQTTVARIVSTMLTPRELVDSILLEFGLDVVPGHGKPQAVRDLAKFLVDQRIEGKLSLLAIDEAQNLEPAALEELRMLSNLETEKSKLLQIMLVGQPSLRNLLARPELEQLRQRVTVSYHLEPLDQDETEAYTNHRLRCAALDTPVIFPRAVTDLIHRHSNGVPRRINIIGDAILLFGYGESRAQVDVELAQIVLQELDATGVLATGKPPEAPLPPQAFSTRESDFAIREEVLAARERTLDAQRRVLANEYRLLRELRDGLPGEGDTEAGQGRGWRSTWPPHSDNPASEEDAVPAAAAEGDAAAQTSRWQRIRQGFVNRRPA
ncbi:MAG TPA: AAA family ATPase [Vicinamibacterales bacterium]|jgi:putative secretion ATPase (PEP-CTERM system associated)